MIQFQFPEAKAGYLKTIQYPAVVFNAVAFLALTAPIQTFDTPESSIPSTLDCCQKQLRRLGRFHRIQR
jgi:hypothetical protein